MPCHEQGHKSPCLTWWPWSHPCTQEILLAKPQECEVQDSSGGSQTVLGLSVQGCDQGTLLRAGEAEAAQPGGLGAQVSPCRAHLAGQRLGDSTAPALGCGLPAGAPCTLLQHQTSAGLSCSTTWPSLAWSPQWPRGALGRGSSPWLQGHREGILRILRGALPIPLCPVLV